MQQIVRQYGMIILSMVAVIAVIAYVFNNVVTDEVSEKYIVESNDSRGLEKLSITKAFEREIIPIQHSIGSDINVTTNKKYNVQSLISLNMLNGHKGKILNFSIIPVGDLKEIEVCDDEVIFENTGLYYIKALVEMDDKAWEITSYVHVN